MTGYPTSHTKLPVDRSNVPSSVQRNDSGYHDFDGLDLTILSVNTIPSSARIAFTLARYVQNTPDEPLHISMLECRQLEIPKSIKAAIVSHSRQTEENPSVHRSVNTVVGHMFSASVLFFCRKFQVQPDSIDLVSFSGQGLALTPVSKESEEISASMITAQTGITSVTGFQVGGRDSQHDVGIVINNLLGEELGDFRIRGLHDRSRGAAVNAIALSYQGLETVLGRFVRTTTIDMLIQSISPRVVICGRITPGARWKELRKVVVKFARGERLPPVSRIVTHDRDSEETQCSDERGCSHGDRRDNSWRIIVGITG